MQRYGCMEPFRCWRRGYFAWLCFQEHCFRQASGIQADGRDSYKPCAFRFLRNWSEQNPIQWTRVIFQVSDVLKELSEGRTKSKVVEFYGRTWTPPSQRIIDRNGDHQVSHDFCVESLALLLRLYFVVEHPYHINRLSFKTNNTKLLRNASECRGTHSLSSSCSRVKYFRCLTSTRAFNFFDFTCH